MIDAFIDAWFRAVGRRGEEAITEGRRGKPRQGWPASFLLGGDRRETVNGADKIRGTSLESNGQVSVGHFHFARLSTSRVCSGMKLLRAGRYVLLVHVSGRTLFFSSLPSVRSTLPTPGRMACARVTCHSFQKGRKVNIISILRKAYIYIAILAVRWSLNRCFPREGSSKILIENVPESPVQN